MLEIDNREPSIIKEYFTNLKSNSLNDSFNCSFKNLEQGDFIIRDLNENILLIIERKNINDLLASVKDSRYTEQSDRYSQLDILSNKIMYIIEGNIFIIAKQTTESKIIYSCIFSLTYKKGFTVLFTTNIKETCELIYEYYKRLYENKESSELKLNLVKKQTITPANINSYMLNLIPGIGLNTAKEILIHFNGKLYDLINELILNEDILNNIKIKSRKISSKVVQNIKGYLIN